MNNIEELEVYAENTRSLLLYLTLNLLNINDQQAYIVASHVGRGVGITDMLKRLPGLYRVHVNMLPLSIMEKNGCTGLNMWDRHGTILQEFYDCILE
jgi:hypothetical protein